MLASLAIQQSAHLHEKCGNTQHVMCRTRVNLHWLAVMIYRRRRMYCVAAHASHRGGNDLRRFSKKGAATDGGVLTAPAEPRAGLAKQQRLHVYCFHSDAGYICQCVYFRTPALGGPNGFRSGGWVNRHSRPDTTEPLPYKRSRVCLPRLYCRRSVAALCGGVRTRP